MLSVSLRTFAALRDKCSFGRWIGLGHECSNVDALVCVEFREKLVGLRKMDP